MFQFNVRKCTASTEMMGFTCCVSTFCLCCASHDLWLAYLNWAIFGVHQSHAKLQNSTCSTLPPQKSQVTVDQRLLLQKWIAANRSKLAAPMFMSYTEFHWGFNCPHPGNVPWHSWTLAGRISESILQTAHPVGAPCICRCEGCSLAGHKNDRHHLQSWKHAHHAKLMARNSS